MSRFTEGRFRLVVAALALGGASLPALALEGAYLNFSGGGNAPSDEGGVSYDTGPVGALALGYTTEYCLRPELEVAVRQNDAETAGAATSGGTGDVDVAMANLWYDLPAPGFAPRLRPYFGAGAGAAEISYEDVPDALGVPRDGGDTVFAYQAGAGLGYELSPRFGLSLGYRFLQAAETEILQGTGETRYRSNAALAGLRYTFGQDRS